MDGDPTDPGLEVGLIDLDDPTIADPEPGYDQPMCCDTGACQPDLETYDTSTGQALYRSLAVPLGGGEVVWTETPNIDLFNLHGDDGTDGVLETAAFRVDIGGRMHDAWASDLTHDGVADLAFVDSDGDGAPNVALVRDEAGRWHQVAGSWVEPAPEPRPLAIRPPAVTGNPLVDIAAHYETTFTETAVANWQHYLGAAVPYPVDAEGYAVGGYRGFLTLLEDHGHLLSEGQVDEIGRIVGQYHATLHTMM